MLKMNRVNQIIAIMEEKATELTNKKAKIRILKTKF
jgi:hypothetical protein